MIAAPYKHLVALVAHARHVPAVERGRFAVAARDWSIPRRGFVLETCHRVETYAVLADELDGEAPIPQGGRSLVDKAAVRHAIAVAVGRDSVVLGEDQILHQLRDAIGTARGGGALDPVLERLLMIALRAGRRARSWRQGSPPSLADLAIVAIERRVGRLAGRDLLVVGAGQMGALAARAGIAVGATVLIASRTASRSEGLANRVGGQTRPFDPGPISGGTAGVIVALRGTWPTSPATERALVAGEAVVVDLSVPVALADELAAGLGRRFISADALAAHESPIETASMRDGVIARLDALIESSTAEFMTWFEAHDSRAAARALADRAESERVAELVELWRRLPHLDPQARELVEGMSRRLASRLIREPLERLGHDPDRRHERAARELFGL